MASGTRVSGPRGSGTLEYRDGSWYIAYDNWEPKQLTEDDKGTITLLTDAQKAVEGVPASPKTPAKPQTDGKIGLGGIFSLLFPKTNIAKLGAAAPIINGLGWAMTVVGVIQIAKAAGLDENIANSLSYGSFAGIMSGKAARN